MPKKKFSDEQISFALGRRTGNAVGKICRRMNIAEATFYCWKRVYVGMGVFEIRQLKQLEDENTKLKRLVADLRLDKTMLEDPKKKAVKPARCRELVRHLEMAYAVSERRACTASGFGRASHRYTSRRDPSVPLRLWLKELAQARVRYGTEGLSCYSVKAGAPNIRRSTGFTAKKGFRSGRGACAGSRRAGIELGDRRQPG